MSSNSESHLSLKCPGCKHSLRVPASASGKQVVCPACRQTITVPSKEATTDDADRWLQLDDPPAPKPKASEPTPTGPTLGASSFDDDLPDLAPLPPIAPSPPAISAELDGLSLDTPLERAAADEEFSFPCKVCGTLLYTSVSRVGSMTRCPDCHSEFSIPSRPPKKKVPKIGLDPDAPDVRLAPVEGTNPRTQSGESNKTKEILDRAALEADRERQELESVAIPFDSQRWLSLLFGCFRDPGVIFLAILLGVFAATCFNVLHQVGRIEMPLVQIWILRAALFLLFGIPILMSILMCCMVIIPMAANRLKRVEDWPFGRFGEAIGEVAMICAAILMAALPGGFLATLLSWADVHPIIREVVVLASIWGLTPILLLSMIENNRILQPFSKIIFDAISARPDAWGSMYFQTGLIIVGLFVLYGIAYVTNPSMTAVFGLLLPFGLFLIANQYGILAGRISDITHLGFEGDFSQDDAT